MVVELTAPEALPARLVVGAIAGFVATLVMDVPMERLPEGETSYQVAAGVLSGEPLDSAPDGLATAVHYGAGTVSGVLFVGVTAAADLLLGGAPSFLSVIVAVVVQLPIMIVFFSYLVLVVYGQVPAERVPQVRRDWALSASVYVAVLVALTGPMALL
ncbi:hypothetical protein [Salinibaculum rarum]|uniref:hypothetical protein n=1 Tax=Salinibaculum rarum TaxID=3058903 RepID=UPI00265E1E09|nr:hypothetical protein [Salinibaculum sp. KK48]